MGAPPPPPGAQVRKLGDRPPPLGSQANISFVPPPPPPGPRVNQFHASEGLGLSCGVGVRHKHRCLAACGYAVGRMGKRNRDVNIRKEQFDELLAANSKHLAVDP